MMPADWKNVREKAVTALTECGDEAVTFFTRLRLLHEGIFTEHNVRGFSEPRKLLRKQRDDGSWKGPVPKKPVYPEDHGDLLATFKAFRILIEQYGMTRDDAQIGSAAEYLLEFQSGEGDIRGFIANQYATYYTGYVLSLLIRAGYADDPRIGDGLQWLLSMRQDDGGWTIPILTRYFNGKTMYHLTSAFEEPIPPERTQPFSHNWTDMVLRAFAAHPGYRDNPEIHHAAELLKSRFFKPDVYSSYKPARYWTTFYHWRPNLLTSLESLSLLGYKADDPAIRQAINWFLQNQQPDGLWKLSYDGRSDHPKAMQSLDRAWLTLRICRMLEGYLE